MIDLIIVQKLGGCGDFEQGEQGKIK